MSDKMKHRLALNQATAMLVRF